MSGRKLRVDVHLDGIVYGPHTVDIPADVAARITNPDAWEGGQDEYDPGTDGARRGRRSTAKG